MSDVAPALSREPPNIHADSQQGHALGADNAHLPQKRPTTFPGRPAALAPERIRDEIAQRVRELIAQVGQFTKRVPALAGELGVDGITPEFCERMYDARSEWVHGTHVRLFSTGEKTPAAMTRTKVRTTPANRRRLQTLHTGPYSAWSPSPRAGGASAAARGRIPWSSARREARCIDNNAIADFDADVDSAMDVICLLVDWRTQLTGAATRSERRRLRVAAACGPGLRASSLLAVGLELGLPRIRQVHEVRG